MVELLQRTNPSDKVSSKKITLNIEGHDTEFLAQMYSNRLFLVATQCESFGSLMNITKDDSVTMYPDNADIPFTVQFLMGVEEDMYKVLAKKLASVILKDVNFPVLLSVALKDKSPKCFRGIIDGFSQVNIWDV